MEGKNKLDVKRNILQGRKHKINHVEKRGKD